MHEVVDEHLARVEAAGEEGQRFTLVPRRNVATTSRWEWVSSNSTAILWAACARFHGHAPPPPQQPSAPT